MYIMLYSLNPHGTIFEPLKTPRNSSIFATLVESFRVGGVEFASLAVVNAWLRVSGFWVGFKVQGLVVSCFEPPNSCAASLPRGLGFVLLLQQGVWGKYKGSLAHGFGGGGGAC